MSEQNCKISLKPIPAAGKPPRYQGYLDASVKALFGSVTVCPGLSFSRSEFFQETPKHVTGMSISGVQQKLSLKITERNLVPTTTGGEYIIKPSPEQYPFAAENEHAAMILHQAAGIDTALCGLVPFTDGELAYITKRFDRDSAGKKVHQEDLLQCFGEPGADKYGKTYEEAGQLINEVTNGKAAVVLDYVKRVILAYAIGNNDMHLKNLSVCRVPGNHTRFYDRLTPSYDNLFCEAFTDNETGTGLLALGLLMDPEDGEEEFSQAHEYYGYYTGYDFIVLADRLGLNRKPVLKFIDKLTADADHYTHLINRSFMPARMKTRAIEILDRRIKALSKTELPAV